MSVTYYIMAKVNEVYRIYTNDTSWKDIDVTAVRDEDVVDYTISESVNLSEENVGDLGHGLDLTSVTNQRLYNEDGVSDTEEAPEE